jgi:4-diphosphocytidyl-2-C-methyl-D-erythritol kinase
VRQGSAFYVVLVKPESCVLTRDVFGALDMEQLDFRPDNKKAVAALEAGDAEALAGALGNVLRTVTRRICPDVDNFCDLLEEQGALGVNMTGSGPTVYGLFRNFEEALEALRVIRHHGPEWCCAVSTAGDGITF